MSINNYFLTKEQMENMNTRRLLTYYRVVLLPERSEQAHWPPEPEEEDHIFEDELNLACKNAKEILDTREHINKKQKRRKR